MQMYLKPSKNSIIEMIMSLRKLIENIRNIFMVFSMFWSRIHVYIMKYADYLEVFVPTAYIPDWP